MQRRERIKKGKRRMRIRTNFTKLLNRKETGRGGGMTGTGNERWEKKKKGFPGNGIG